MRILGLGGSIVTMSLGLLVVAIAYAGGRASITWAEMLFWPGLIVLFVPSALSLTSREASRSERLTTLILLGLTTYVASWLSRPTGFPAFDGLLHMRTAVDIMETGRLFVDNPLLPASPLYPALEIIITALSHVTGLSLFAAGLTVIAVARVFLVLAIFLLYETIADSSRIAGLGTALYMVNPLFFVFDANISYESLAISLAVTVIFAIARIYRRPDAGARSLATTAALLVGVITFTHHITSFVLTAFLFGWAFVSVAYGRRPWAWLLPALATLSILAVGAWLLLVAQVTIRYLSLPLSGALADLLRVISGEGSARAPFTSATATFPPLLERVVGLGSAVLIGLSLPVGLYELWRRYRGRAIAVALGLVASAYPASLVGRLVSVQGAEASYRISWFVFLGVAFVVAIAADRVLRPGRLARVRLSAFAVAVAVLFTGGVVIGTAPFSRLPGPYLVTADQRSLEAEGIEAARWMLRTLGPDHRIIADRTNWLLMGTYGHQTSVEGFVLGANVSSVFLSPQFGDRERDVLRNGAIAFIVVDRRLSTALPALGFYFSPEEQQQGPLQTPLDPRLLEKFESAADARRVFDSGSIVIYDVREITGAY